VLRRHLNAVAAAVLLVEMQVEAALLPVDGGERLAAHAAFAVLALCVALRTRAPVAVAAVVQAVYIGVSVLGPEVTTHAYLPLFVVLGLNVSAAKRTEGRRFAVVVGLAAVGAVAGTLVDPVTDGVDLVITLVFFAGLTAVVGRLLRTRGRLQAALRSRADRLEVSRAEEAEAAAAAERARIAAELQDIVGHAVSGMVVQASAARRLAARDPARAREAFAAVEASGRDALAELRRLLGVLRHEDADLALAPTPSLQHVSALAARARAAGLPVELEVRGEPVALPAGVDLTAYRVVQEALREALETGHAGRAQVLVAHGDGAVEVVVRDDGRGERVLLGARERVSLVGGELHAGAEDGGHAVRARLPVGAVA
jgi:signal transduction histidine kinase